MNLPMIVPNKNDILLGRGGINHTHPGNVQLRVLAGRLALDYNNAGKKMKTQKSRELVQHIHALWPPGRFLQRNKQFDRWEVALDDVTRNKASQALRDAVTEFTGIGRKDGKVSLDIDQIRHERDEADSHTNIMGGYDTIQASVDDDANRRYNALPAKANERGCVSGVGSMYVGGAGRESNDAYFSSGEMEDSAMKAANVSKLQTMINQHTALIREQDEERLARSHSGSHARTGTTTWNPHNEAGRSNAQRRPSIQSIQSASESLSIDNEYHNRGRVTPSTSNVEYYKSVLWPDKGPAKPAAAPESVESSDVDMETDRNGEYQVYNAISTKFNQNSRRNPKPEMATIGEHQIPSGEFDGSNRAKRDHYIDSAGLYPGDIQNGIRSQRELESRLLLQQRTYQQEEERRKLRETLSNQVQQSQLQQQMQIQMKQLQRKHHVQQQVRFNQQIQQSAHEQALMHQLQQARMEVRMQVNSGFNGSSMNMLESSAMDEGVRHLPQNQNRLKSINSENMQVPNPQDDQSRFMSKTYRGLIRRMKKQHTQPSPCGLQGNGHENDYQSGHQHSHVSFGMDTFSNLDTFSNVSSTDSLETTASNGVDSERNLDMNDFDWQGHGGRHY